MEVTFLIRLIGEDQIRQLRLIRAHTGRLPVTQLTTSRTTVMFAQEETIILLRIVKAHRRPVAAVADSAQEEAIELPAAAPEEVVIKSITSHNSINL